METEMGSTLMDYVNRTCSSIPDVINGKAIAINN